MSNNYKDWSESLFETCKYKISILNKTDDIFLNTFCESIQEYLELKFSLIHDKEDYIEFRNIAISILQLFGLLIPSVNYSSKWILNIVHECYEKLGISSEKRKIIVVQSAESSYHDTSDAFQIAVDILNLGSFKDILPESLRKEIMDVFIVPSEAQFDLSSLTILGHEIGHVNWQDKIINNVKIQEIFKKSFLKTIGKKIFDLYDFEDYGFFVSQCEENYCDKVGRSIFGVVFDIAMLKIMSFIDNKNANNSHKSTHPPINFRLNNSLLSLNEFIDSLEGDEKVYFSEISEKFDPSKFIYESYRFKDVINLTTEKIIGVLPILKSGTKKLNVLDIWKNVSKELDAFRPPIERVSLTKIEFFSPSEIIIGTVLYYYFEKHFEVNNEYFTQSDEEYSKKQKKLKNILKNHLVYSISIYKFLLKAKKLEYFNLTNFKSPLWDMRERMVGKQSAPLVIVPSIYPKYQYGQNSVDLRLGSYFLIHKPTKYTHICPYPETATDVSVDDFYEEVFVNTGEDFVLQPHQFILATTLEYISLPFDYYALILGRSSWGRLGLNIATATTVQAGFRGAITLELRNLGETPLQLKVGARIAQLCLIKNPTEKQAQDYYTNKHNKYIGPIKAETPKIKTDIDWELLL